LSVLIRVSFYRLSFVQRSVTGRTQCTVNSRVLPGSFWLCPKDTLRLIYKSD